MKKGLILLGVFVGLVGISQANAATTSATPAKPASPAANPAQEILDRVSDKVAKMGDTRQVHHGKIHSLGTNSFSLLTDEKEVFVETSDATDFFRIRAGQKAGSEFKNLRVGTELTVIGHLDETTKIISARVVIDKIRRHLIYGQIETINKNRLTLVTPDGVKKEVDIADTVSQKKVKGTTLVNFRDPELAVGDYLSAIGFYEDDQTYLTALRLLLVLQEPASGQTKQ